MKSNNKKMLQGILLIMLALSLYVIGYFIGKTKPIKKLTEWGKLEYQGQIKYIQQIYPDVIWVYLECGSDYLIPKYEMQVRSKYPQPGYFIYEQPDNFRKVLIVKERL